MAISASHPRSVICELTRQSPSQFGLNALMLAAQLPGALALRRSTAGLPFAGDLTVVLDAERVGAKDERVLVVVERIEDHDDRIDVGQRRVTARLADDDLVGLAIEADDAEVNGRAIEQHADFGPL